VGGTDGSGDVEFVRVDVDGDDLRGPRDACALHDAHADSAATRDCHGAARRYLRGVKDGAESCDHAATHERPVFEGKSWVDCDDGVLVDEQHLGPRPDA